MIVTVAGIYSLVSKAFMLLLWTALPAFLLWVIIRTVLIHKKVSSIFPSPPSSSFFLGHSNYAGGSLKQQYRATRKLTKEYGSRFLIRNLHIFTLNLSDPACAEALLTSSKHITKGLLYKFLLPWLGQGLLTSTGTLWHSRRKLLTPAFHFRILENFAPQIQRHADDLVDTLKNLSKKDEGPIDVIPYVSRCTLWTILETAMGAGVDFRGEEERYFNSIRTLVDDVGYRITRPWTWFRLWSWTPRGRTVTKSLNFLHATSERVIRERKAALAQKTDDSDSDKATKLKPFLDVLLIAQKNGADISDTDIRNEVDTFTFEGHETTSMGICWTLFMLGHHPEIQEIAAKEVLESEATLKTDVGFPYLERVIKESLRLYPPVFFVSRRIETDLKIDSTDYVPAGANVHLHIFLVHRNPDQFPDPNRFDPDRFLPENERSRHPFAYIPFSGGLRNCIGKRYAMMELKIVVSSILRHFRIRSEHSIEDVEYHLDPTLVLRTSKGIHINFYPR